MQNALVTPSTLRTVLQYRDIFVKNCISLLVAGAVLLSAASLRACVAQKLGLQSGAAVDFRSVRWLGFDPKHFDLTQTRDGLSASVI